MMRRLFAPLLAALVLGAVSPVLAIGVLAPGDPIIAIDLDVIPDPPSSYPENEAPQNILDSGAVVEGTTNLTKYLNFGERNSGFIVTPNDPSILRSFQLATANDAIPRDPASWSLWGTNDPITSLDNSEGLSENWTLIGSGDLSLPDERNTLGPVVSVDNNTSYGSYRMTFPTVKNASSANSMQIADVYFYSTSDGTGPSILAPDNPIIAIKGPLGDPISESTYPANEPPAAAIDGIVTTKYLNFGENNSGFIVTPSAGPTVVDSFRITTANDAPERDPASWRLFGTNDLIESMDNSAGDAESWTLIDEGTLALPDDRLTPGEVVTVNNTLGEFSSYRMVFDTVKSAEAANSMQIAEIEFNPIAVLGDYNDDGVVDANDWPHFRAGYGGEYSGMTALEAYMGGDLDGDFDSDLDDFNIFVGLAGGSAALFGSHAVPEPSSLALLGLVLLIGGGLRRIRPRWIPMCVAALLVAHDNTATAQTFTNIGPPVAVTTPDPIEMADPEPGPINLFDDTFLDSASSAVFNEQFFNANYANEPLNTLLQYAGLGPEPKTVFMDYGSTINANWFAYAQRVGGDPLADKVGKFEFWFSNSDFNETLPATAPDATFELQPDDSRLDGGYFLPFTLSGEHSGRYVAMRLTLSDMSAGQPVSNLGGHEFRLLSGPSDVVLEVDRSDGSMTLRNDGPMAQAIEMKSYVIESATGGLDPAGFNGIGGDSGAFPSGNGSGNGWEVGGGSNANRLAEAFFSGTSTLAAGTSGLALGSAYNEGSFSEDLFFKWTNSMGHIFDGRVTYVGTPPAGLAGDYNNNGTVDAADYTVWRDALGSSTTLPNDSSPGVVDQSDYDRWKTNFGQQLSGGTSASTAVPEPGVLALSGLAVVFGVASVRQRRI